MALVSKRFDSREDIVFGAVIDESRSDSLEICVLGKAEMEGKASVSETQTAAARAPSPSHQLEELGLASEIAQDDSSARAVHKSKLRKKKKRSDDQDEFTFTEVEAQRGYFQKTDRNEYKDEDLDVPTYLRRGIKIKIKA